MLRETDGTWDNGYTHAWTQGRAALRPRGIVHRKVIARRPAFSHGARPRAGQRRLAPRDAAHDRLRLTRHDGERDDGSVMAVEVVRRVLAVAS
eukprot:1340165-Prymnesium_polylepis.1